MPLVSVLLPVYNAARDLQRALNSLQAQTLRDFEILAIDDGSTDDSGQILEGYARRDPRLRVFHQPNAGALGEVLNRAAELAAGRYLARQDADDASTPIRLEAQVNYLEAHPATGLCGTWSWFIDTDLGPLFSYELPDRHERIVRYLEAGQNPLVHGSMMMRRELFEKTGGYRGSYSEDFDLWLRLGEITRLGMCQKLGYYYWRSLGGINTGANQRQQALKRLMLQLHNERLQSGHELTDWQSQYHEILGHYLTESSTSERQAAMHYARGIHLLRLARWTSAYTELQAAASGIGPYAHKAARNLRLRPLWAFIALVYRWAELREPFRYAHALPAGTRLPDFDLPPGTGPRH